MIQTIKRKLRERFFRYDSSLYPIYFWKRFPLHHIPTLILQRLIIYTFLGRQNRILPVRFQPLQNLRMRSFHAFLGGLRYFGWWENEVRDILRTYLPQSKSFVEIGAMEGFYEIIAHKLNPHAVIVAVEPNPGARERIKENFLLNKMDFGETIRFNEKFVGTDNGSGKTTMAELLSGLPQPVFLIMDIDGGEEKALRGGIGALATTPLFLLIETHSPDLEAACIKILTDLRYETSVIKNSWWRHLWPEERPAPQHGKHHNRWLFAKHIQPH